MKRTLLGICVVAASSLSPAVLSAQDTQDQCESVVGDAQHTLIPAPNDPFGRILGPSTGSLRGAITAIVTSLTPTPDGTFEVTVVETWVMSAQDQITFDGQATFTPIPGEPIGTVSDELTLTVARGKGEFEGATGQILVTGIGYDVFGPNAGPGNTYFELSYSGSICRQ